LPIAAPLAAVAVRTFSSLLLAVAAWKVEGFLRVVAVSLRPVRRVVRSV